MKLFKLNDDVIVSEVDKLQQMTAQTIEQAIHVGHLLQAKKDSLGHGQWIPWIENTLPITRQQVSKYLLLAGNEQILVSDGKSGLHLAGINDAVQVIRRAKGPETKAKKPKARKPVAPSKQFLDAAAKLLGQVDIATLHRWIDEFIAPLKDPAPEASDLRDASESQPRVDAISSSNHDTDSKSSTLSVAAAVESSVTPPASSTAASPITASPVSSVELAFAQEYTLGRKVKVSGQDGTTCDAGISIEDSEGLIGVLRQSNGELAKFWAWKTPEGGLTHFHPKHFFAISG